MSRAARIFFVSWCSDLHAHAALSLDVRGFCQYCWARLIWVLQHIALRFHAANLWSLSTVVRYSLTVLLYVETCCLSLQGSEAEVVEVEVVAGALVGQEPTAFLLGAFEKSHGWRLLESHMPGDS